MPADTRKNTRVSRKLFFKHIIRKIFLEDWAMKLVALLITFGLWLGVTGLGTPSTKRLTVPLNPNISNSAEITSSIIAEVDIVVSGDKRKVDQLNKTDLAATLDLTDVLPGDRVISLSPENVSVSLPQGIKLIEIQPSRIAVKLEAVQEKEVEVQAAVEGSPAAGYEVYSTTVLPPRIRVRGPVSFISQLEYVQTGNIDISGKASDFAARQIPVGVDNPKSAVLDTVVDVFFRIGEKRIERSFSLSLAGPPHKIAKFTIRGPRTMLLKARAEAFKVNIAKSEDGQERPELIVPPEIQDLIEIIDLTVK